MLNRRALCMALLPLVTTVGGCLFETTLDAMGGGTMTASVVVDKAEFPRTKAKMESSAVKLTSSELVSAGKRTNGVFKLSFADVTKLATTQYFRNLKVTRAKGSKDGTMAVKATFKNSNPLNIPDSIAERFGNEVKVVVKFPGPIVESNGTNSGDTVTWQWTVQKFFNLTDVEMTATYTDAGAPAAASGASAPTAGAGDKPTPAATAKGKAKSDK